MIVLQVFRALVAAREESGHTVALRYSQTAVLDSTP